jgi:chromosome segregation ATPase
MSYGIVVGGKVYNNVQEVTKLKEECEKEYESKLSSLGPDFDLKQNKLQLLENRKKDLNQKLEHTKIALGRNGKAVAFHQDARGKLEKELQEQRDNVDKISLQIAELKKQHMLKMEELNTVRAQYSISTKKFQENEDNLTKVKSEFPTLQTSQQSCENAIRAAENEEKEIQSTMNDNEKDMGVLKQRMKAIQAMTLLLEVEPPTTDTPPTVMGSPEKKKHKKSSQPKNDQPVN